MTNGQKGQAELFVCLWAIQCETSIRTTLPFRIPIIRISHDHNLDDCYLLAAGANLFFVWPATWASSQI